MIGEAVKALIDRVKADPRTTWLAGICIAAYGAGEALREYHFEPAGSILIGVGGLCAAGALIFTKFAKPKDGE